MSSIPSGAVPITFAADRSQIDNFLAELRKGVTVPLNLGGPSAGASSFLPGVPRPTSAGGGSASGGDRQMEANARRVDSAWDRAMLAQQKAAEAAERRARAQEERERRSEQRERQRAAIPERIRDSDLEQATPIRDSDLVGGGRGRAGRGGPRLGRLGMYTTVGFASIETARVGEAWMKRGNELALARTGEDRIQAEMGFAGTISGVPLLGNAASIGVDLIPTSLLNSKGFQRFAGGAANSFQVQQAIQQAQMGNRAVSAALGTSYLEQQTRTLTGSVPGIDRQIQQLRDEADSAKRRAAVEDDPAVRAAMNQQASALRLKNEAEIKDLNRQRERAMERENRRAAGLGAAVEGHFGVASERDFNASLEQAVADAEPLGPAAMRQVWRNNRMRRAARDAEIALRIQDNDFETRALGFDIGRNGLAAARERLSGQMEHDLAFAATDEEAASIGFKYANRRTLLDQQNQDAFRQDIGSIRDRNESLDLYVNGPGTPSDRERASSIDAIRRRTQLQELAAFQDRDLTDAQKQAKASALAAGGALDLGAMREDFLRGLKPEEVNINRQVLQGPGTENAQTALDQIQKAIEDLKTVPQKLDDVIKALGGLVAGA